MMPFTLNNFLIYFSLAWGSNIALNFLYVAKRYIPKFSHFDYPLDLNLNYKKNRLLGDSTTILGLILCSVLSLFIFFYSASLIWSIAPLIVYAGHLLGSFIKRRLNKNGGEFVPIIDHGDYMLLLGIVFVALGYINFLFAFCALLLTYILHPLACRLAFKFKLRDRPY